MTDVGFVIGGYVATIGGLAAYAAWVVRRGKVLSRRVPPEERRWL